MDFLLPKRVDDHAYMLLDVARYLACVSVFVGHFFFIFIVRIYGLEHTYYDQNVYVGAVYFFSHAIAVMVFFVLSGFLIGYKALQEIHEQGVFNFRDYLKKRILRIIPPLYFALLFLLVIYGVIKVFHLFGVESYALPRDLYVLTDRAYVSLGMLLKCLLLVPGDTDMGMNPALWSLSYEFYYYLLFALVLSWVVNKNIKQVGLLASYVVVLPAVIMVYHPAYVKLFFDVWVLALVWLFGVLIAYRYLLHQRLPSQVMSLGICLFLLIVVYPFVLLLGNNIIELVGGSIAAFLIIFLLNFKFKKTPPQFLFKLARGSFYTYTLYLIHVPILFLAFSLVGRHVLQFTWLDYLSLGVLLFAITSILSFYLAQVLENRWFWEACWVRLKSLGR